MATSKPFTRYSATPVPFATSAELRGWLTEEFDAISSAVNGLVDFLEAPIQFLYGGCDDVELDTVAVPLLNYAEAALRGIAELPDKATGTIIIPETGLYTGVSYVYGTNSSPFQNEEIHLLFQKNADPLRVAATFDVASNQTDDRVLNASLTADFNAGDVLNLWINATNDLGTMSIVQSTFQIARIR